MKHLTKPYQSPLLLIINTTHLQLRVVRQQQHTDHSDTLQPHTKVMLLPYLKIRFPTSSAFQAFINAKSAVMAVSMIYGLPLKVSDDRIVLAISTLKTWKI